MVKQVLGRGLGALLGGAPSAAKPASPFAAPSTSSPSTEPLPAPEKASLATSAPTPALIAPAIQGTHDVPLALVHPCPFQPRKDFPEESLNELALSIREKGIIQPLVVRPKGDGYELIAGERRWRAATLLKLEKVPIIIREADDRTVLELALVENLQRENLNPIDEALGFAQLIQLAGLKQEEAAAKVGKSRASVANALRLLKLPADLQVWVRDGRLSVGHAKVIMALDRPDQQKLVADKIIRDGLSVRQTEGLVAIILKPALPAIKGAAPATPQRDPHVADVVDKLQTRFGTKVNLRYHQGKGSVEIRFFSDDELERILQISGIRLD
jgi:ParB family chromosome partitioning protein